MEVSFITKNYIKRIIAIILATSIFVMAVPIFSVSADEETLILSNCTSGWSYSGNSSIDYSVSGTSGTALEVVGAYGTMRPLSFSMASTDISGYATVHWDMYASNMSGQDVLPDILSAYSDLFYVKLGDSNGKGYTYPLDEVTIVRTGGNWYRASVELSRADIDLKNFASFTISTLSGMSFCETLPQTRFRVDSLGVSIRPDIIPVIAGAQIDGEDRLRFIASVKKHEYEALKEKCLIVEYGFLVADSNDYSSIPLEFSSSQNYKNYSSNPMYLIGEDTENLYYTVILSGYNTSEFKNKEISVRAYIICTVNSGDSRIYYSNDDLSGGYEVSFEEIKTEAASKEAINNMNKINVIEDTTPITNVKPASGNVKITAGTPYAVDIKYDDNTGVCIAIYDVVRDFNAPVNDLTKDSSTYIQRAMNAAKEKGGGVVYIPEGVYRCEKPITVPGGVTLRGEWQSPDVVSPAGSGTVLLVRTGDKAASPEPFVSLKTGGGFRNITVLYPATASGNLTEFSSTIAETPAGGSDSYTVMNVTILGGSVGFDAATAWSELHYLKNVYISNLSKGIQMNNVTDIGRLENIHISPRYLLSNSLIPMSEDTKKTVSEYIYNNADGLYIQRSDWEYVYELYIDGVNRAIAFESYIDTADNNRVRGSNGQMFGVEITGCKKAFDVVYTNAIGYAVTDVKITDCEYGFDFGKDFLASFEITNLDLKGRVKYPIKLNSQQNGKVSVTNSEFECDGVEKYVVTVNGGSISLQQCAFSQNEKHVIAESGSGAVSVLGCKFPSRPDISRTSGRQDYIKVDNTALDLPVSEFKHVYRRSVPTAASMDVYDVTAYGAVSGYDSTAAFIAAIGDAKRTGGTVYVPQGEYYVNQPLVIPSGVELKGVYDVPTHSVTKGSVIFTTYGKNNENAAAFISLEENSGISGISFYYPEQSYTDFIPYAWTVRSLGKNCWAENCVFINSYNALDFGTNPSDGHYVNYIGGSPLRRGIFIGNNSSNGWVENVQFNPHYWKRANISILDTTDSELLNNAVNQTLEAMIFGDNASEHVLGTFGYAAKDLLVFRSQGGKGTNGVFIGHGSDGCRNALVAHELDRVVMINAELVSMNYTEDMHHIVMNKTVTGTLAMFNMTAWAQPLDSSIKVDGGELLICQLFYHNLENTSNIAEVSGGTLFMSSSMLPIKDVHFKITANGKIRLKANLSKQTSSTLPPACREALRFARDAGAFSQTHSWWV